MKIILAVIREFIWINRNLCTSLRFQLRNPGLVGRWNVTGGGDDALPPGSTQACRCPLRCTIMSAPNGVTDFTDTIGQALLVEFSEKVGQRDDVTISVAAQ